MIKRRPNDLQEVILNIYKEVKKICDENNLAFYAEAATIIGAIAHKGFVPWDDDIDIRLVRDDYERFKKIAPGLLPDYLKLHDGANDPNADYIFLKVHDTRTMFTKKHLMDFPESYTGVFIDIAPIDGASSDIDERDRLFDELDVLNLKNLIRKTKYRVDYDFFVKKITEKIPSFSQSDIDEIFSKDANFYSNKMHELAARYKFSDSYYAVTIERAGWSDLHHYDSLSHEYSSVITMPFEDTTMSVPAGYKDILRKNFGCIPDERSQIRFERERGSNLSMHADGAIISLNNSVEYYTKQYKDTGIISGDYVYSQSEIMRVKNPKMKIFIKKSDMNVDCSDLLRAIKYQTISEIECVLDNGLVFDEEIIKYDRRFVEHASKRGICVEIFDDMSISEDFTEEIIGVFSENNAKRAAVFVRGVHSVEVIYAADYSSGNEGEIKIQKEIATRKTDYIGKINQLQEEINLLKNNVNYRMIPKDVKRRIAGKR